MTSAAGFTSTTLGAAPRATSVIICAYTEDRWSDLEEAIASVRQQTVAALETIVVIDHNPDMLARVKKRLPDVVAVANSGPPGLSGARNTGVAMGGGEIIAFLDDDAVAGADWLERLQAGYRDSRVLGVGGSIEPTWLAGPSRFLPAEFNWVVGCTYRGMPMTTAPVRNLIGANMSFRRDVLASIGGFRSEIGRVGTRPMGCEETELCIRARRARPEGRLLFEPAARIRHKVPSTRSRWSYFVARCYSEGLSKARVADFVGSADALSTERSYVLRTLPAGFLRGLGDALGRRDAAGLLRSAAILVGLGVTIAGYLAGRITPSGTSPDREGESS